MSKQRKWRAKELEIVHVRAGGPGGQNRNKRMSGVRVFHRPSGITVIATERRSQAQNLAVALQRLEVRLEAHYYRPPPRHATQKTLSSDERRLKTKKKHARLKHGRQNTGHSKFDSDLE